MEDVKTHLKAVSSIPALYLIVPGVLTIDELCIWRLNQHTNIGSVHVVLDGNINISELGGVMDAVRQCLCAFNVHFVTIQPDISQMPVLKQKQGIGKDARKGNTIVVEEDYI
ncbi:hypothetical protein UA08_03261 [Talaromyces atroroseus]|uniref:Cation efflux protein cytoplasmic domain-containing protein n=1 Tax=Talaromyces atroroseus TaxID=1441469 RepID=A0A225AJC8_TALAT|nr:hypothetical protein UA08_03261 [Talaromyces atroroseus]OKL61582.1 hypothetical protein UA08_03261 [Talaromyces atroroseus]